jgi:hypothetical protein
MNEFNTLFPNFLNQCEDLRLVLIPIAFVLVVTGIISSTVTGHRSPSAYLRTMGRTLAFVAVLALIIPWGNQITQLVDHTVKETLHADPAKVHAQYQEKLQVQKGKKKSWLDLIVHSEARFEALISFVLLGLGWLGGVIVFYAYLVQKFILYLGYAFSPLFIAFLAVRTLHSIGVSYLLGLVGVMLWPLGWGAASIMTQGLIDFMTDQSFLITVPVAGEFGYTFQNLLGLGMLGLWLIFSTIAAPVIIGKTISTGAQIGQAFASGAATAGTAAATSGAGAAAAFGGSGGAAATLAGLGAGAASAVIGAAEASLSGSSYSPMGSLLSSLAHQRRPVRKPPRLDRDDITGDKAVQELLRRSKG